MIRPLRVRTKASFGRAAFGRARAAHGVVSSVSSRRGSSRRAPRDVGHATTACHAVSNKGSDSMVEESEPEYPTVKAQVIEVADLQRLCSGSNTAEDEELNARTLEQIRHSLGREGLGIIAVRGVEGLEEARESLLPLADELALLPPTQLKELEDEASSYSIGWSHGKETLEGGVPDTFKGSFYANPIHDSHDVTEEELELYPSYTRPNVWPHDSIPELKASLMRMGDLIVAHGKLLARACDLLTKKELGLEADASLGMSSIEGAIEDSFAAKARLLHYFPPTEVIEKGEGGGEEQKMGNWCGWHLDHGSLTGLTGAMFTDCKGGQVANPDPKRCGLYVKTRKGEIVRVTYTKDCVAYQVGESSEVMSNGVLKATPHCVVGAEGEEALGVARNTFAVFMQPKWDLELKQAEDRSGNGLVETKGFEPGMNFGEFTQIKLDEYYS